MLTGRVPKPWWRIAVFSTREEMEAWIRRSGDKAEWGYVFINNKYGIEHRRKSLILARKRREKDHNGA